MFLAWWTCWNSHEGFSMFILWSVSDWSPKQKISEKKTFKRWCLNPKWFSDSLVTPRNGPSILGTFWRVQVDNMYIQSDFNQYIYIYILCFFMFVSANFIGSSRIFGVPLRFMTFWCSCWFWNHSIFLWFEGDFDTPPRPSPPPIGTARITSSFSASKYLAAVTPKWTTKIQLTTNHE